MPLHQTLSINETTKAYFWHITEDVTSLFRAVSLSCRSKKRLDGMKSESQIKGFLAVRMLLQQLGYSDEDLTYDASGKPHLNHEVSGTKYENENPISINHYPSPNNKYISISHSHDFAAICFSDQEVGIDIEIQKEKTLKIASRYMDVRHLVQLSTEEQIAKATTVWGIKEAVFKIKNEKGISFPDHIFEADFRLSDTTTQAELHFDHQVEPFAIHFQPIANYIFVCALRQKV
jgi:phosphopantetheinyl transferase